MSALAVARRCGGALDLVVAAVALAVTAPVLLAAPVAIRLESRGHAVFRQRRVGRDGVPFELFKLRTMVHGAEGMGVGPRRRPGRRADHRASARSCGAPRWTSCRTSSTCCAGRCR